MIAFTNFVLLDGIIDCAKKCLAAGVPVALRTPYMVVARGRVLREPKVRKMPQVERELDKFL